MFGLFGKSDKNSITVIDKVWMSKAGKMNACRQMLKLDPSCIFIVWFEETRRELIHQLQLSDQNATVLMAENVSVDHLPNRIVAFVEHHPLRSKELAVFKNLRLAEINVLSSLDEPFFAHFGGEKTIELMRKMGMKEDEVLGHAMINKAIKNAQEKIGKKLVVEKMAASQEEWFKLNVVL